MTIIAGFKCQEGVVLCADTQETVGDISKRNVPKLRFEPSGTLNNLQAGLIGSDLAVAFCGATTNGPFMDEIMDSAWKNVQTATSFEEACESIKTSIKRSYKEFGEIYQPGYCPEAELIYGVKMQGQSRLFDALGPAVNEKSGYASGGIGSYLADFLVSRMYESHLSIRQCVIIAAYVLFQTKEHVNGCGGDSHIAILRNKESSGTLHWKRVEILTNLLEQADKDLGKVLIRHADLRLNQQQFTQQSRETIDLLATLREHDRKELQLWENKWLGLLTDLPTDDLGLPLPSGGEKD